MFSTNPHNLYHGHTHDELTSDIGVETMRSPLPHIIQFVHWWTWNASRQTNTDSSCLFSTLVAILLYVDDVVYCLNKEHAYNNFWTSYMSFALCLALKSIYKRLQVMIFGHNNRKSNQEAFYLDKDHIEITHEYKYLVIFIFIHMVSLSHLVKAKNRSYESLDGHLKERSSSRESYVGNSNPLYSSLWCFQVSQMTLEFGKATWKILIGKFSRRAWKCIRCPAWKCVLSPPVIICWPNMENSQRIIWS